MKNNKLTVTIAIPAHNEENSLPQILSYIKNLKLPSEFKLENLILVSDGSTDKTPSIIEKFSSKNFRVTKLINNKRKGKIYRLNQLFASVKTKYLVIVDADIRLEKNAIQILLASANKHGSALTVSHQIPIKPKNFVGKIIYRGYEMWNEIRTSNEKYLDNHQNFYGASSVYDYRFYHTLRIPLEFQDERKYIYFSSKNKGSFWYEKKSIIYYHPVSTYNDLYVMGSRSDGIDKKIERVFGKYYKSYSEIPFSHKFRILIKHLFINPFETILYLVMKYWIQSTKKTDPLIKKGTWTITTSTKTGFKKS